MIPKVDIVIPVYNEENRLRDNVLTLCDYFSGTSHFTWNIIIADNGSTDATPQQAGALARQNANIRYVRIPRKGRGYALRKTFLESRADVVSYMDVDLSTNLRHFNLLIEGIASGYDIAVGSRLMPGARIERRLCREIFSRGYNGLIHCLFFNTFSDAQCGFKAMRADAAHRLVPLVENNNWFFDTELMLLAEHNRCRILEIPVEWIQDIKSKVHIPRTVAEDLMGLARLRATIHRKKMAEGMAEGDNQEKGRDVQV